MTDYACIKRMRSENFVTKQVLCTRKDVLFRTLSCVGVQLYK